MRIIINDDFSPKKIEISGQCFRVKEVKPGVFRFMSGENVVYIEDLGNSEFSVSCTEEEWNRIWFPYFDMGRNYNAIFEMECDKHPFVHETMLFGKGLRILRQEPWEMLITFIISQRKSIPAISKAVELISEKFGHTIVTEYETLYSFPSPEEMANANEEELASCGLGYRVKYVLDAIDRVLTGKINLEALYEYDDTMLLEELQKVFGVGKKVANCVALFAYGRMACVPIDVWIARAIEVDCNGKSPFHLFGENAGIIQQYVFYYEKHRYD